MVSLQDRVELWRSASGKLHLSGENDRARCGLPLSLQEKIIGTLSDVTCLRCKGVIEEHSQEVQAELQEPDPNLESEAPKEATWNLVFRFEENEEGPRLCWCGCGQPVKGKKARFVPGHDARLYTLIRKIEEGEINESVVPEKLRQQMVRCACCGKPILPHESGMGPLCRTGKCHCKK